MKNDTKALISHLKVLRSGLGNSPFERGQKQGIDDAIIAVKAIAEGLVFDTKTRTWVTNDDG